MFKINDKVRIIGKQEIYLVYALGHNPIKHDDGDIIPPRDFDCTLKKVSHLTEGKFEPYIYVYNSAIQKI